MTPLLSRFGGLSSVATGLSFLTCYGTLAVNLLLGALGAAVAFNEFVWAGFITGFAMIAVLGLAASIRHYRRYWPVVLGAAGLAVIIYAMYIEYHRWTELAGFALLVTASVWNWSLRNTLFPRQPNSKTIS
jgi:arsenite methyltransferase